MIAGTARKKFAENFINIFGKNAKFREIRQNFENF
jgi:hypothetical protein